MGLGPRLLSSFCQGQAPGFLCACAWGAVGVGNRRESPCKAKEHLEILNKVSRGEPSTWRGQSGMREGGLWGVRGVGQGLGGRSQKASSRRSGAPGRGSQWRRGQRARTAGAGVRAGNAARGGGASSAPPLAQVANGRGGAG